MPRSKSPKQSNNKNYDLFIQLFVDEYLKHFVGARAYKALRPDVLDSTANSEATKLIRRPEVIELINKGLEERKKATRIDTHYVISKLHSIVEADYISNIQFLTKSQFDKIPEDVRRLIQDVQIVKTKSVKNYLESERTTEKEMFKVTFMSKDKAVELLGRHTGAWAKDNESTITHKGFAQMVAELGEEEL